MNLQTALKRAQIIQAIHPKWAVCGSLGMMLLDVIPERDIHDIDFCTRYPPTNRELKRVQKRKEFIKYYDMNAREYLYLKFGFPENCCLFWLRHRLCNFRFCR